MRIDYHRINPQLFFEKRQKSRERPRTSSALTAYCFCRSGVPKVNESADSHREAEGQQEIHSHNDEDRCSLDKHGTRLLSYESSRDS